MAEPAAASTTVKSAVVAQDAPGEKKVVVCKYVDKPGGDLDHIVIVGVSAIPGFLGVFPFDFTDAQDSRAIRYAADGEQARDVNVGQCTDTPPPPPENEKKVVICKFVGEPPGTLDHIIIVGVSALGPDFDGTFPYPFPDAQDSFALRFALDGEQAKDVSLSECEPPPPPVDVCPDIKGDQPVGTVCTTSKPVVPETPKAEPDAVLPNTGGTPLWMLVMGGALTAGGVVLLRGARRPAVDGSWGGGAASVSLTLPPKVTAAPVRNRPVAANQVVSHQVRSEWLMVAGGVVAAVAAVLFGILRR